MKVKSESEVTQSCLTVTPWTAVYQAPLPMGFSRQEYWSGVPLPSPKRLYYEQVIIVKMAGMKREEHVSFYGKSLPTDVSKACFKGLEAF